MYLSQTPRPLRTMRTGVPGDLLFLEEKGLADCKNPRYAVGFLIEAGQQERYESMKEDLKDFGMMEIKETRTNYCILLSMRAGPLS